MQAGKIARHVAGGVVIAAGLAIGTFTAPTQAAQGGMALIPTATPPVPGVIDPTPTLGPCWLLPDGTVRCANGPR
jgi:hypothetical protein